MIKEALTSSPSCIRRCHHHQPKLLRLERRGDRAKSSPPHRVLLLPPSRLGVAVNLAATVTMETATIISEVASSVRAGRGGNTNNQEEERTLVGVFLAIAAEGSSATVVSSVTTTIAVPIPILKNLQLSGILALMLLRIY